MKPATTNAFPKIAMSVRNPLSGKYLTDIRGNAFHPKHQKELQSCCSCDRLICEPLTGGGRIYPDKRPVCNICFKTAINDQKPGNRRL